MRLHQRSRSFYGCFIKFSEGLKAFQEYSNGFWGFQGRSKDVQEMSEVFQGYFRGVSGVSGHSRGSMVF